VRHVINTGYAFARSQSSNACLVSFRICSGQTCI